MVWVIFGEGRNSIELIKIVGPYSWKQKKSIKIVGAYSWEQNRWIKIDKIVVERSWCRRKSTGKISIDDGKKTTGKIRRLRIGMKFVGIVWGVLYRPVYIDETLIGKTLHRGNASSDFTDWWTNVVEKITDYTTSSNNDVTYNNDVKHNDVTSYPRHQSHLS